MKKNILCLGLLMAAFCFSSISCGDDDEKMEMESDYEIEIGTTSTEPVIIRVPNEGGHYTVSVKTKKKLQAESMSYGFGFYELYDYENGESLANMRYEFSYEDDQLKIFVDTLNCTEERSATINLTVVRDDGYPSKTWASVTLIQKGRETPLSVERPLLGDMGMTFINLVISSMAKSYTYLSLLEQDNLNNRELKPDYSFVNNAWTELYAGNEYLSQCKYHDSYMLNVYGDYFDLLRAMSYTTLATLWGNVPYIKEYKDVYENGGEDFLQKPHTEILADLKVVLTGLMGRLEEKVNRPFGDANDFFFASRDVARMLLADICLFEGNYAEAKTLLEEVIGNGFYQLDASSEYTEASGEIIFALRAEPVNTSPYDLFYDYKIPTLIPRFTLSDAYLSLAECHYHMGDESAALENLHRVTDAKGLDLPEDADILAQLQQVRERLLFHSGSYFTFLKRNGLAIERCGIEEYRLLLPIPSSYIQDMERMGDVAIQNDGY